MRKYSIKAKSEGYVVESVNPKLPFFSIILISLFPPSFLKIKEAHTLKITKRADKKMTFHDVSNGDDHGRRN